MAILRTIARVYDRKTHEYVQRIVETTIPDDVAEALIHHVNGSRNSACNIRGYGHGDDDSNLDMKTVLRDQELFHIDPMLEIVINDKKGEPLCTGGWQMM